MQGFVFYFFPPQCKSCIVEAVNRFLYFTFVSICDLIFKSILYPIFYAAVLLWNVFFFSITCVYFADVVQMNTLCSTQYLFLLYGNNFIFENYGLTDQPYYVAALI